MIRQLRAVHHGLRQDLVAIREALDLLTQEVDDRTRIPELIDGLTVADFTWQMRVNCDYYCLAVDRHHLVESDAVLPVMRRRFPAELGEVVDRLHTEHQQIAALASRTRRAGLNLSADPASVAALRQPLTELGDRLLAHLDYEEASLFPYFLRMDTDWHFG